VKGLCEIKNCFIDDFSKFTKDLKFDVILNFVGVGSPIKIINMAESILDTTYKYDEMAINYVKENKDCKYIFLSSGAAYGSNFDNPVDQNSKARFSINNLEAQDWYGISKFNAECRHRSLGHLGIVDLRIFNYFSHSLDLKAGSLITDLMCAIKDNKMLETADDEMVRDYIGAEDFFQIIQCIFNAPKINTALDCYSKEPIDKKSLLEVMEERFELQYKTIQSRTLNATGKKPNYYSINKKAKELGYEPKYTSLENIIGGIQKIYGK